MLGTQQISIARMGEKNHVSFGHMALIRIACLMALFGVCNLLVIARAAAAEEHTLDGVALHTKSPLKKTNPSSCEPSVGQRKPLDRTRGCLVSLSELDRLLAQKNFNFIDVRSPIEYDHYRIAGSINIPQHLVKTKIFLKKEPIVLVNEGRTTIELEKTCEDLKKAGFERVNVLEGGLLAWYVSKRHLDGDAAEPMKLNRMSPEELFEARRSSSLSVIDVSNSGKNKDMRPWLPAKIDEVPVNATAESMTRLASVISNQRRSNPQGFLLLIADDSNAYERIDLFLNKSNVTLSYVLRLEGGYKSYRDYVEIQNALLSQQNQPKRYESCRG